MSNERKRFVWRWISDSDCSLDGPTRNDISFRNGRVDARYKIIFANTARQLPAGAFTSNDAVSPEKALVISRLFAASWLWSVRPPCRLSFGLRPVVF